MFKKIVVGILGLGVLTNVLACDCQKVDNQALEVGRTQQVIFIINHFDSKEGDLKDSGKTKVEAFGKAFGKQQAVMSRVGYSTANETLEIKQHQDDNLFSTSLNKDLRLENKNDLLK